MKPKTPDDTLDVRKLAAQLKEYEDNPRAPGGLKFNMPLEEAVRAIAGITPKSSRLDRRSVTKRRQ